MGRITVIARFVLLGAISGCAQQQTSPSTQSPTTDAQSARVKVYAVGPGVTAPELLPLNLAPFSAEKCKKKVDGKVVLSLLVDATGRPRNLMFLHPLGTDLDRFALQIVTADRFKPGTHDGAPVAIGQSVEVSMEACVEETEDNAGKKAYSLRLTAQPGQKLGALRQTPAEAVLTFGTWAWKEISDAASQTYHVGGSVTAPVPLNSVEAQYTPEARKARINGKCLISLTVDRQGMPQNVQVMRTLDPGLDQNAMDAVNRYRFKPAMRNGEPVPVKITVEVKFEIS